MKILCFALFACAFNLLIGFIGFLSFGHTAFFGGAGYIAGYALKSMELSTEFGILLGTATAALIGLVMGGLAIRRRKWLARHTARQAPGRGGSGQ